MNDFDAEADMVEEMAATDRTARAGQRVHAFNTLPAAEQYQQLRARPDPEWMRAARKTLSYQGRPGVHVWLDRLEDECIDQLPPEDQKRF